MENLLAQDIQVAPKGGFKGFGPLGNITGFGDAAVVFIKFISTLIGVISIVAFIWFTFVVFLGAVGIISSGGDKGALESSKKKITTGLIGLIIVISAIFIIKLVGTILGIDILNIAHLIGTLVSP